MLQPRTSHQLAPVPGVCPPSLLLQGSLKTWCFCRCPSHNMSIDTGKTTFIKFLLDRDYPGLHIGPEPTTDRYTQPGSLAVPLSTASFCVKAAHVPVSVAIGVLMLCPIGALPSDRSIQSRPCHVCFTNVLRWRLLVAGLWWCSTALRSAAHPATPWPCSQTSPTRVSACLAQVSTLQRCGGGIQHLALVPTQPAGVRIYQP